MRTHAYIDASNLFYGGKKSLGWSVDYKKLYKYLEEKYGVEEVYFFGGVEIYKFPFNYLTYKSVPLKDLIKYLIKLVDKKEGILNEIELRLLSNHL